MKAKTAIVYFLLIFLLLGFSNAQEVSIRYGRGKLYVKNTWGFTLNFSVSTMDQSYLIKPNQEISIPYKYSYKQDKKTKIYLRYDIYAYNTDLQILNQELNRRVSRQRNGQLFEGILRILDARFTGGLIYSINDLSTIIEQSFDEGTINNENRKELLEMAIISKVEDKVLNSAITGTLFWLKASRQSVNVKIDDLEAIQRNMFKKLQESPSKTKSLFKSISNISKFDRLPQMTAEIGFSPLISQSDFENLPRDKFHQSVPILLGVSFEAGDIFDDNLSIVFYGNANYFRTPTLLNESFTNVPFIDQNEGIRWNAYSVGAGIKLGNQNTFLPWFSLDYNAAVLTREVFSLEFENGALISREKFESETRLALVPALSIGIGNSLHGLKVSARWFSIERNDSEIGNTLYTASLYFRFADL